MPYISAPSGPIVPDSLAGIYRSSMSILETAKSTQSGSFSSILLLLIWASYLYHMYAGFPSDSICVTRDSVDHPLPYIVNIFTPDSMFSLVMYSLIIVVLSVTLEKQVGSLRLASVFVGNCIALCVLITAYFPKLCFPGTQSLGPLLASLVSMLHGLNIRVFTEGLSANVRLPFSVEPRWHCWFLLLLATMTADNDTLLVYAFAVLVGAVPYTYNLTLFVCKTGEKSKKILIDSLIFFASVFFLPFTISIITHPLSGPSFFELRAAIVRDAVSLVGAHCLLAAPFLFIAHARFRSWLLVPMLLGWVYGTQTPAFALPGPGFVGLAFLVYRIVV